MPKTHRMSRRSFLNKVVGAAALTGSAGTVTGCAVPRGPGYTGVTDADYSRYADRAGYGRGRTDRPAPERTNQPTTRNPRQIFCTDRDSNATNGRQDPSGYGRCRNQR